MKIEQYEEEFSRTQNCCVCKKCNETFIFEPDDVWWDEHGYGYSTKLVRCKECGIVNVIKHTEDYGLNVNFDSRFYLYK